MSRTIFAALLGLLCVLLIPDQSGAHDGTDGGRSANITIKRDPRTFVTQIFITAKRGEVRWSDVVAGLARARGYDDSALKGLVPNFSFPLNTAESRWSLTLWNMSLPGGVRLAIIRPDNRAGEPKLRITLNRAALLASQRRFQKQLRTAVNQAAELFDIKSKKYYGLKLDKGWQRQHQKPLIVIVPGFQASGQSVTSVAKSFRKMGYRTGTYHYPNDQPIDESARTLSKRLKKIAKKQPARKIRMVAFSMGGLVARRVLEDRKWDPGNVEQLVMVATPNHGSRLAGFGFALELWEHVVESKRRTLLESFYESVEDGLGEASEDMTPDSVFLRKLNARPRNPRVRYSLFLGTKGAMSAQAVADLRVHFKKSAKNNRFVRFFGPQLDKLLTDLDEVIHKKGDGVVAVSRGRLKGVKDVVLLDFDHLAISGDPETPGERQLRQEIIARMTAKR